MKSILIFALAISAASAKVFGRCELAQEMVNVHGFSRSDIGNWICLIQHESSYNTGATNTNTNGSKDYGLFQINDGFWCADSINPNNNDCNVDCSRLIDSSISDDCDCAKIIHIRHGYDAWYGWINYCKGTDVESYVSDCF